MTAPGPVIHEAQGVSQCCPSPTPGLYFPWVLLKIGVIRIQECCGAWGVFGVGRRVAGLRGEQVAILMSGFSKNRTWNNCMQEGVR